MFKRFEYKCLLPFGGWGERWQELFVQLPMRQVYVFEKNEEKMAELFENSRDTELKNDALKIVEHFIGDRPGVWPGDFLLPLCSDTSGHFLRCLPSPLMRSELEGMGAVMCVSPTQWLVRMGQSQTFLKFFQIRNNTGEIFPAGSQAGQLSVALVQPQGTSCFEWMKPTANQKHREEKQRESWSALDP